MNFWHVLHAAIGLLVIEGRLSHRRLRAEFDLNDSQLEALRFELVEVKRLAIDQDGQVLVWAGDGDAIVSRPQRPGLATRGALRLAESAPLAGADQDSAPPLQEALPAVEAVVSDAERRPLTVMFCDLADSTALSTKLDPEDLQDVIRAYRERCAGIIAEYEGFVAKFMGDGILVYFGYPKSLERNAERAIRTALAIVEAMAGLNLELGRAKGIAIAVRIGIATGVVVVGEIVGEGLAQERTVIGEAPNIAARLQSIAPRNGIVIGALTKETAGDIFVYEDLGAHELKGIPGLVKVSRVTGLRDPNAEQEAEQAESDTGAAPPALVGRDEEIGLLRRAWQSTKDEGRGQVVLISGEPGIGKSVLVDGLRAEVRAEGLPRIVFRCSPYHTNSALYPVIEHVKRLAQWQPEDTAETRLRALETTLSGYSQPLAEVVPLYASLLSLPLTDGRYPPLALSPLEQKQQTEDALIAWTLEEAERQPMLEVWEDLHWADPSTLELLGRLVEQVPTVPLLIVLTFRPDFLPGWPTRSHMTPITLNRLERQHSEALLTRLARDKPLPAEVVEHVIAKSDGVPLYVEELTKAILGSDILREEADHYALTGTLSTVTIPATLQESLMARLDRLPKVREVTQLGAVLGRDFAYEMLRALAEVEEEVLRHSLAQLVEAELLYQRGRPPRARYVFKHALLQDAAYQSLLKRKRQQYHRQVAELLEERFPETAEDQPELVAHHYAKAGLNERALVHLMRAGEQAVRRSANAEAIAHATRCLDLLSAIPDPLERARLELAIRMILGPALIATKGYGALEVQQTYARARVLCSQLQDQPRMFPVLRGLWNSYLFRAEMQQARERAAELLSLARNSDDAALVVEAHRVMSTISFFIGDFPVARSHAEQGVALYDPDQHRPLAFVYGADPGVICGLYGALSLWMLGYSQQAEASIEGAIARAREVAHGHTEAFALTYRSLHHLCSREVQSARESAEAAIAVGSKHGIRQWSAWSAMLHGWSLAIEGETEDGIRQLRAGLDDWRAMGNEAFLIPFFLALLAEALVADGQVEEALAAVCEALTVAHDTEQRFWEAQLHRVRGELLLAASPDESSKAEACFHQALEVARQQRAKAWELRAATSLARLWRGQGKPKAARKLLAPVYDWFTEGFDTADLKDAKELLDELARPALVQAAR